MPHYKALESHGKNFQAICKINDGYRNEVGTSGDREFALKHLEGGLKKFFKAAKEFQQANMGIQSTDAKGVKALAAFHESQNHAAKAAKQKELNDKVIRMRKWFSRQGAWFSGEDGINWPQTMKLKVIYDTDPMLQTATKVSFVGGRLITASGEPLDTSRMVTAHSGPGAAIFVMSAEGNLHVHSHSVGHYHHSSLLAAAAVAGAGELIATGGRIKWLSNKSGHYWPNRANMLQVLAVLQAQKIPLDFAVTLMPANKRYPSVDAFMKDQGLDNDSLEEAAKDIVDVVNAVAEAPAAPLPPANPQANAYAKFQSGGAGGHHAPPVHGGQANPYATFVPGAAGRPAPPPLPGAKGYAAPSPGGYSSPAGQRPAGGHYDKPVYAQPHAQAYSAFKPDAAPVYVAHISTSQAYDYVTAVAYVS